MPPTTGESTTESLAARFMNCTLPKSEWTQQAHLRVGLWHVMRDPPDIALARLREGITRLNETHGTANTETSGYHESITRFYVGAIARFVAEADLRRPIDDLAADLISHWGDRDLPLRYYSRELLFSIAARRGWVQPDLLPLE